MALSSVENASPRGKVSIETLGYEDMKIGWLGLAELPRATRVDYIEFRARGDFRVSALDESASAICDLETGEFIFAATVPNDHPIPRLLRQLLRLRLQHLDGPGAAGRIKQGETLRGLADLTGGLWFPYEALNDVS